MTARGSADEDGQGTWLNDLRLVPASMPYRPPRLVPRPSIHGYELATVVGPDGSEIHTDLHGRVRVHFPWDREHAPTAEDSSCWMRVMQSWSGPGCGSRGIV
ncbi:MAG: type VI secretion system tip protein VgrG, partial [Myxococcales bacterium]|nr:type VI secretion system tip protein VgrG [Myxococcales bacterium]